MRSSLITPHDIVDQGDKIEPGIPTVIVLRAGVLVPEAAEKFGTYHEVFSRFFQDGFIYHHQHHHPEQQQPEETRQHQLQLISFNVLQNSGPSDADEPVEYPSDELLGDSIGLLISGSAANAYDDLAWITDLLEFSKDLIHRRHLHLKLFGICFGHQIFARALGANVLRNPRGWELGIYEVQLSPLGQSLFHLTGPLKLHQVHRDIVASLPPSTLSLGSTDKCAVHGFLLLDDEAGTISEEMASGQHLTRHTRLLALQGHPEYSLPILRDLINARTRNGSDWSLIDSNAYHFALNSIAQFPSPNDHHGALVSAKFLHILNLLPSL